MAFDQNYRPPQGLRTDEFLLRQLVAADNQRDYEAVMESKEFLRIWEDPSFPPDDFTAEDNLKDVIKMEGRHNSRHSFIYTMMNLAETQALGCVYIAPTDVSWLADSEVSPIGNAQWSEYNTSVSFWVRPSSVAAGLDQKLFGSLLQWLNQEWPARAALFFTAESLHQQIALFESAGLMLKFRTTESGDTASSVAFG